MAAAAAAVAVAAVAAVAAADLPPNSSSRGLNRERRAHKKNGKISTLSQDNHSKTVAESAEQVAVFEKRRRLLRWRDPVLGPARVPQMFDRQNKRSD